MTFQKSSTDRHRVCTTVLKVGYCVVLAFLFSNFFINKISQGRKSVCEKNAYLGKFNFSWRIQKSSHDFDFFNLPGIKSRPCENYLAEFRTSALLKPLKINCLHSKKKQMVKLTEIHKRNYHIISI